MAMRGGRRFTLNTRPPSGVGPGAIPYVSADGLVAWLAMPDDAADQQAAGTPYVLVGGADGLPAWIVGSATTVGSGFGSNYGNDFGGP
jgi:hypothetical protein